jgi:hypothetical protein
MKSTFHHAKRYLEMGLSVIPLKPRDKPPNLSEWKQYQTRRATEEEIDSWFKGTDNNIGIVCGKVSGDLVVVDFDDERAFRYCFSQGGGLAEKTLCARTSKGVHVYLRLEETTKKTTLRAVGGAGKAKPSLPVDIQGEGGYVVAPPSIHPSGKGYTFINEVSEIAVIDGDQWTRFNEQMRSRAEEWPIVERLLPAWNEGSRQNLAMGVSGFFRKTVGFNEDRVVRIIEGICEAIGDTEVDQRTSAVHATFSKEVDDVAVVNWLGEDLFSTLKKVTPARKTEQGHKREGSTDNIYRFELSDNEWAVWTPEFLDLETEHGHGRASWKHVIKGYVRPLQKLVVDGEVYFQYELSRGEKRQFKVDQMAKYLKGQGAIFQGFRALDVLSAISNGMVQGEKIAHATFGVYAQENGHLELCKDPIPIKDEQAKAWEKVSDHLAVVATAGDVSHYVEMLSFWHQYEVFPCLGLSFIAPFTPILRSKGIMVPHHFAWAPEHDLGKSRVSQMFSEKLWAHDTVSGGSISSPYRLASHVDSICLAITIEEAEKVPAQLWPMLKDVAERWLADKRGTQDLKMLDYRSRAVLFCTGNSQPINSGPTLKRFLINRFDSGARRDRRKRSAEMDRLFDQLRPIGYHALSVFLEECGTVDKFIGEIRQFECALNAVSTTWASPKRPEAWACVYCGMRIFESLCRRLGLTWRTPSIGEFYENIVKPVEESTWAAKSTALESFLNWFSMYRVDHTKRFDGTEKIAGIDEVFSHAELTIREEHISGWWVTSALLQQYNKQAEDSEKITSLKEVAQQSADALRIPYNLVLDNDGKHARNVKIGPLTQRAAFVADTYEDYRNRGNLVTDYEPDELPNAGNQPFSLVTKLPSYQNENSVGNLEPDTPANSEVTRLPRFCTPLDERMTGLLQDYHNGIGQSQLVEKWGPELVGFALEKGLIPRIGGNNVD